MSTPLKIFLATFVIAWWIYIVAQAAIAIEKRARRDAARAAKIAVAGEESTNAWAPCDTVLPLPSQWTNLANPPEHLREKVERLLQLYWEVQREITNAP